MRKKRAFFAPTNQSLCGVEQTKAKENYFPVLHSDSVYIIEVNYTRVSFLNSVITAMLLIGLANEQRRNEQPCVVVPWVCFASVQSRHHYSASFFLFFFCSFNIYQNMNVFYTYRKSCIKQLSHPLK